MTHPPLKPTGIIATLLLTAIAIAVLHQHPEWHGTAQRASCPAAVWHTGAVLGAEPPAPVAVTWEATALPDLPLVSPFCRPAARPWSCRAPPLAS